MLATPLSVCLVLAGTVVAGTVAHELSHAVGLTLSGVACEITLLPERDDPSRLRSGVPGTWATVTPTEYPRDLAPWQLRVTAILPLCLVTPFGFILSGVFPNPFAVGDPYLMAAAIGWAGCAIPSPQDFALLWYPEQALADATHELEYGSG